MEKKALKGFNLLINARGDVKKKFTSSLTLSSRLEISSFDVLFYRKDDYTVKENHNVPLNVFYFMETFGRC